MICEEKYLLTEAYIVAVTALTQIGKEFPPSTREWRDATEQARARCESARIALKDHRSEHGC
jgi:hypothetical protein